MATAAEGDGGGTVVARLFVGGLAEGVSAADLEGVFGSIGRVAGVEFVRTSGRCFAYVDFECPSDKALTKLFSTYNGCKWKGGKLKLEKAKEHYLVRLKREWEQEAAAAAAAQEVPAEENVEKPEDKEKRKLERDALLSSKVNIYFPKLRKDEQFRKRKQFEDASAQNKRQKLEDSSEPRNKKQSSSVISERKTTTKSLSAISGANHSKQKSSGLPLGGTHGFSSVLYRAKSSGGLQGVDALTDPSTKKEGSQSELATEPKKGSLWTQKSAWRDLVGGMGAASFSLSQVLPNTNPAPAKLPTGSETSVARAESKKKVTFVEESLNSVEAVTQPSAGQKFLPSSMGAPSTGTTDGSAGHDSGESSENNKVVEARVVPKITIGEVCPFMRNKESEQQWSKAKKVLTGFNKRGEEKAGSSNAGRGKAPSRRR